MQQRRMKRRVRPIVQGSKRREEIERRIEEGRVQIDAWIVGKGTRNRRILKVDCIDARRHITRCVCLWNLTIDPGFTITVMIERNSNREVNGNTGTASFQKTCDESDQMFIS